MRAQSEVTTGANQTVILRRLTTTQKADEETWRRLSQEFFDACVIEEDEQEKMLSNPGDFLRRGMPQKSTSASVAIKWHAPPGRAAPTAPMMAAVERASLIVSNNTRSSAGTRSMLFYGQDERVLKRIRQLKKQRLQSGATRDWTCEVQGIAHYGRLP